MRRSRDIWDQYGSRDPESNWNQDGLALEPTITVICSLVLSESSSKSYLSKENQERRLKKMVIHRLNYSKKVDLAYL
jgi:hypothetical protein